MDMFAQNISLDPVSMLQMFGLGGDVGGDTSSSSTDTPTECLRVLLKELLLAASAKRSDKSVRDSIEHFGDDESHLFSKEVFAATIKLSCDKTASPKLVQTGLSILEKIIESGLCDTSDQSLMDNIVGVACSCVSQDDEQTQFAVLHAISYFAQKNFLHGQNVMSCVRTCYLVHKESGEPKLVSAAVDTLYGIVRHMLDLLEGEGSMAKTSSEVVEFWTPEIYAHSLINKAVLLADPDNDGSDDNRGKFGWCVVCDKPAEYFILRTRDPICSWVCKKARDSEIRKEILLSSSLVLSDLTNVFRSICKLSLSGKGNEKTLASSASSVHHIPDPRIVRAKQLSLEVARYVLERRSERLTVYAPFVEILQHVLFVSLLTNSVSPVPLLSSLSLDIFVDLLRDSRHRMLLIREIGIFVDKVLIYVLESSNTAILHKQKVIEVFGQIFTNMDCVVELFNHFDCAITERNVVELSLAVLAKTVTAGTSNLSTKALDVVVGFVSTVAVWADDVRETAGDRSIEESPEYINTLEKDNLETTHQVPEEKMKKINFQNHVLLFNEKPEKALRKLVEEGFIEGGGARSIATWILHNLPILSKSGLGELFGDTSEFSTGCFYAFVDGGFDFSQKPLDTALREFLSVFKLPGEAQKIDRIMEKFAQKYTNDNPLQYPNADCAYVLSFAAIMLNTDLHSSNVKHKMTEDQFVNLGKGINAEIEISETELRNLFNSIKSNEIKLTTEQGSSRSATASASDRFEQFVRETEQLIANARASMSTTGNVVKGPTNTSANSSVCGLLSVVSKSVLLALRTPTTRADSTDVSTAMASPDNLKIDSIIISSLVESVKLLIKFELEAEKQEFFFALFQIATGGISPTFGSPVEPKSVLAINSLLQFALHPVYRNGIGAAWKYVCHIISAIDKFSFLLFQASTGRAAIVVRGVSVAGDEGDAPSFMHRMMGGRFWSSDQKLGDAKNIAKSVTVATPLLTPVQVENINQFLVSIDTDQAMIDSVFLESHLLNPFNLVELVSALVVSSDAELREDVATVGSARLFSCQKLVEVANVNMTRIRIVWSRIWNIMAPHLVHVAMTRRESEDDDSVSKPNTAASLIAIDSLRQIAVKYLSKPELANYHFQAEFLKPFLTIISDSSKTADTAGKITKFTPQNDLILSVVESLITSLPGENVKSGWTPIFAILTIAADSRDSAITEKVLKILSYIAVEAKLGVVRRDYLEDFFNTVVVFAKNKKFPVLESNLSVWTIVERVIAQVEKSENCSSVVIVLRGLAQLCVDPRESVRDQARTLLFKNLLSNDFDQEIVKIFICGIMTPLYDEVIQQAAEGAMQMALAEQILVGLSNDFTNVVIEKFAKTYVKFLGDIFNLNVKLIEFEKYERISLVGISAVRKIVVVETSGTASSTSASETNWTQIITTLVRMVNFTLPKSLLEHTALDLKALPFDPSDVMNSCVNHLNVLGLVNDLVDHWQNSNRSPNSPKHSTKVPTIDIPQLIALCDSIERSYSFAVKFNSEFQLRVKLKTLGFMKDLRQLPRLIKQESLALSIYVKLLWLILKQGGECQSRLKSIILGLSREYLVREQKVSNNKSGPSFSQDPLIEETETLMNGTRSLLINVILGKMFSEIKKDPPLFEQNKKWIFDTIVSLVKCNDGYVREAVASALTASFAP